MPGTPDPRDSGPAPLRAGPPLSNLEGLSELGPTRIGLGPFVATIVAGPMTLVLGILVSLFKQLPHPVTATPSEVGAWGYALIASIFIGPFFAVIPNFLGSTILILLGRPFPMFRATFVWIAAGAAIPSAIFLRPSTAEFSLPLIATGAFCAFLCRRTVRWNT